MASHFALFVDLENCGGKKSMLMDVIERVKIRGDILIEIGRASCRERV